MKGYGEYSNRRGRVFEGEQAGERWGRVCVCPTVSVAGTVLRRVRFPTLLMLPGRVVCVADTLLWRSAGGLSCRWSLTRERRWWLESSRARWHDARRAWCPTRRHCPPPLSPWCDAHHSPPSLPADPPSSPPSAARHPRLRERRSTVSLALSHESEGAGAGDPGGERTCAVLVRRRVHVVAEEEGARRLTARHVGHQAHARRAHVRAHAIHWHVCCAVR
jgi:hypothetical protein